MPQILHVRPEASVCPKSRYDCLALEVQKRFGGIWDCTDVFDGEFKAPRFIGKVSGLLFEALFSFRCIVRF